MKREEGLPDTVLEAFRELSYAKAGPFRAPADAKEMQGVPDKFEKFFSPNPGSGS